MTVTDRETRPAEPDDLMSVGDHCCFPECGQLDFLPFKCSGCKKIYCLDHRTAGAHSCPHPTEASADVLVCPLCAGAVRMQPGEDPNVTMDRHTRTACDPSNYARVHKKKKCPVKNCREKLTEINKFQCKECGGVVCLKHRLAADHSCPGKPAHVSRTSSLKATWANFFSGAQPVSSSGTSASARQQQLTATGAAKGTAKPLTSSHQPAKPAATKGTGNKLSSMANQVKGSLQAQLQDYRSSHQQHQQQRQGGSTNGGAGGVRGTAAAAVAETCTECGHSFRTVQELLDHAAATHQDGWRSGNALNTGPAASPSGGGGGGLERCPHCSAQFNDPVALVQHVETVHNKQQGTEVCVLC